MRLKLLALCGLLLTAPAAGDIKVGELLGLAEDGDAVAQTALGLMYLRGEEVVADERTAARWFHRAAQQGTFIARYALGSLVCPTCAPPPDYAESARRYRAAAQRGAALAQTNLAFLLAEGRGVGRDPVEALMWYEIAARTGQEGVAALAARQRDALAARLTAAQVAEAQARAAQFKPRSR